MVIPTAKPGDGEGTAMDADSGPNLAYQAHGNCYLNLTSRCTLRCAFCPKFHKDWEVDGYDLRLHSSPSADEVMAAVGAPQAYAEVVFCGLGEPTLRLPTLLEVADRLKAAGAAVRLNTDGLASWREGRDVTPELDGRVDTLSVSLNAQNET
ncbi:MAG: TatD family nuclease-associated radical SAM protein, partial [Thiohalorhabdaceae bacterium]